MELNLSASTLKTALDDAGLDTSALRTDYSGRGMYGRSCLALTGSLRDYSMFLAYLAMALFGEGEDPDDIMFQLADTVCQDSMGLDRVYYWPDANSGDWDDTYGEDF